MNECEVNYNETEFCSFYNKENLGSIKRINNILYGEDGTI